LERLAEPSGGSQSLGTPHRTFRRLVTRLCGRRKDSMAYRKLCGSPEGSAGGARLRRAAAKLCNPRERSADHENVLWSPGRLCEAREDYESRPKPLSSVRRFCGVLQNSGSPRKARWNNTKPFEPPKNFERNHNLALIGRKSSLLGSIEEPPRLAWTSAPPSITTAGFPAPKGQRSIAWCFNARSASPLIPRVPKGRRHYAGLQAVAASNRGPMSYPVPAAAEDVRDKSPIVPRSSSSLALRLTEYRLCGSRHASLPVEAPARSSSARERLSEPFGPAFKPYKPPRRVVARGRLRRCSSAS